MDFSVSEEHSTILDTCDKIAQKYNRQYWLKHAHAKTFPQEMWDELADIGYLGMTVPEEYGGAGLGMQELALMQERLAEHGVGLLYFVVNQGINAPAISRHGTEDQKQRILPGIANGTERACFAITEPNAGTNTFEIETFAKKDGDDYVLNGQKLFISTISQANNVLVVARTVSYKDVGGKENRKEGMSLFIVPTDAPGLTYTPMDTMMLNTDGQYFVFFDNVRIPKENLLGVEGKGLAVLFDGLNPERIMVAAGGVGAGRFALKKGVDYANQRVIFDRPIGAYQGVQHPMAEAKVQLEHAALMHRKAAWLHDNGLPAGNESNMAKILAADANFAANDAALQAHGGYGFTESMDMLHGFIGSRLGKIAPINKQMGLNYVSQHILGLPKSY